MAKIIIKKPFQLVENVLHFKLPNIPIVTLTSTLRQGNDSWTPLRQKVWRELHSEWFKSTQNGMHIITNKSGHYIHKSQPELVLNAIKYVVNYVRTDSTQNKN